MRPRWALLLRKPRRAAPAWGPMTCTVELDRRLWGEPTSTAEVVELVVELPSGRARR